MSTGRSTSTRHREALLNRLVQPILRMTQRTRGDQLRVLGARPGAVLFLGDSITEGGLWEEWFPDVATSNRGVGGETSAQVLRRLDSAVDDPRAVFLLVGTNDLAQGATPTEVAACIDRIVVEIGARAPGCPVFLQSVMPRKQRFAVEIRDLNARLRRVAQRRPGVQYVDLWPALATPSAELTPRFTNDSLHLNGEGYLAWTAVLRPLVDQLASTAPTGRTP